VIICDGASRGNPGPASIGIIIWERYRESNQRMIKPTRVIKSFIGNATNMEAEWTALLRAVCFVVDHNLQEEETYIYNDSQTVVKQANDIWKVKHDNIKPLYAAFKKTINKLSKVNVIWVPRQLIYLADKAAQQERR